MNDTVHPLQWMTLNMASYCSGSNHNDQTCHGTSEDYQWQCYTMVLSPIDMAANSNLDNGWIESGKSAQLSGSSCNNTVATLWNSEAILLKNWGVFKRQQCHEDPLLNILTLRKERGWTFKVDWCKIFMVWNNCHYRHEQLHNYFIIAKAIAFLESN